MASVVQTGYTTPTQWFSVYTKPPCGCSITYIYVWTKNDQEFASSELRPILYYPFEL